MHLKIKYQAFNCKVRDFTLIFAKLKQDHSIEFVNYACALQLYDRKKNTKYCYYTLTLSTCE